MKYRIPMSLRPITRLYNQYGLARELRRDLNLVVLSVLFGMIHATITTGPGLAGFARDLGAGDFYYALLMALPVLGGTMQLAASWIIERTRRRKKWFILFGVVQRSLWLLIALVPWIVPMVPAMLRLWAVIALVTLSSMTASFVNVGFFSWMGDLIPLPMRGRFLALRLSISTAAGVAAALAASWLLDNIAGMAGYTVVFSIAAVFGTLDIVIYLWIKDPPMEQSHSESFAVVARRAVRNRPFLRYLLFWTVWAFCWNLTVPFNNVYALGPLGLSFQAVTLAGQVAGGVVTVLTVSWWGRHLDARSAGWVLRRGVLIMAGMPLLWLFARPGAAWPLLLFNLGYSAANGGISLTSSQMLMTSTPPRSRSLYVALYAIVTSIAGAFVGYLAGGALLELMGPLSFTVAGLTFDRYKLLFLGGGALQTMSSLLLLPLLPLSEEQQHADR
ncbi:MAG: MFS transporter [Clostridiales bacterium]|nr:MFS transporter [Clostridiales bacterium]